MYASKNQAATQGKDSQMRQEDNDVIRRNWGQNENERESERENERNYQNIPRGGKNRDMQG